LVLALSGVAVLTPTCSPSRRRKVGWGERSDAQQRPAQTHMPL